MVIVQDIYLYFPLYQREVREPRSILGIMGTECNTRLTSDNRERGSAVTQARGDRVVYISLREKPRQTGGSFDIHKR